MEAADLLAAGGGSTLLAWAIRSFIRGLRADAIPAAAQDVTTAPIHVGVHRPEWQPERSHVEEAMRRIAEMHATLNRLEQDGERVARTLEEMRAGAQAHREDIRERLQRIESHLLSSITRGPGGGTRG